MQMHACVCTKNYYSQIKFVNRFAGLGIYGDSNSESEEENTSQNEHSQQQNIKEIDSDDELKVCNK